MGHQLFQSFRAFDQLLASGSGSSAAAAGRAEQSYLLHGTTSVPRGGIAPTICNKEVPNNNRERSTVPRYLEVLLAAPMKKRNNDDGTIIQQQQQFRIILLCFLIVGNCCHNCPRSTSDKVLVYRSLRQILLIAIDATRSRKLYILA